MSEYNMMNYPIALGELQGMVEGIAIECKHGIYGDEAKQLFTILMDIVKRADEISQGNEDAKVWEK